MFCYLCFCVILFTFIGAWMSRQHRQEKCKIISFLVIIGLSDLILFPALVQLGKYRAEAKYISKHAPRINSILQKCADQYTQIDVEFFEPRNFSYLRSSTAFFWLLLAQYVAHAVALYVYCSFYCRRASLSRQLSSSPYSRFKETFASLPTQFQLYIRAI